VALGGASVLVAAFACGPGSLGDLTRGRPRGDAGTDADPCPSRAVLPERPTTPDSSSIPPIILAMEDLRAATDDSDAALPKPRGFDLDHTCTGFEPPSCVAAGDAAARTPSPDGRDNAAGPLLTDLGAIVPGARDVVAHGGISSGRYTFLFLISDWNGTDDDPQVSAAFLVSPGTRKNANGDNTPPVFDGNDLWDVDPAYLRDGGALLGQDCANVSCTPAGDTTAFVRGGVLVAQLPQVTFTLNASNGTVLLPMNGATLTAQLTRSANGATLRGEIGGRLPTSRLVNALGNMRDVASGKAVCDAPGFEAISRQSVCAGTDLALTPAQDRVGAPCQAISISFAFLASPAKLATVREVEQVPNSCPLLDDPCAP
jgi:hypothetical protein